MSRMRLTALNIGLKAALIVSLAASPAPAETLTLDRCIDLALENHGSSSYRLPSLLESENRASNNVWSAWGNLLPSLSHNYRYSESRFGNVLYDPTTGLFFELPPDSRKSESWSNSFTLSHVIFDGGRNVYQLFQSYHNRAAARAGLMGAEISLISGVKERYYALLKNSRLVDVRERAVERAREQLKTIDSKYELGSASLSDVLKARVSLGQAELTKLQADNNVETSRASLNAILGRDVNAPVDVEDITEALAQSLAYDAALDEALRNEPSLESARRSYLASKDQVGIARSYFLPVISWSWTRNWNPRERNDLLDFDSRFGTTFIGASLSYSIFDGFWRKTQVSTARAGAKYAKEQWDQTKNDVALAVKQAHLGVELSRKSYDLAVQNEESAQQDYNLAQEKYDLGAATILDLLDAQVSLTTAETDKVNALYDYHTAVAKLEAAIGRGR